MLYQILFFFLSSPVLVTSLRCASCRPITVNYLVTSDTVPEFSQCAIINATRCLVTANWNENTNTTSILVSTIHEPVPQNMSKDLVTGMVFMENIHGQSNVMLSHALAYSCLSSDQCNNQNSLKQILRSLTIEDQFRQELSPLLKIVSPFDAKSAACFNFNNFTSNCPPDDLNTCERCQTAISKFSTFDEVCGTCPEVSPNENVAVRSTVFVLEDRIRFADHVQLDCQLKGCNSMVNTNQIYKASTIKFDFDKFFEH